MPRFVLPGACSISEFVNGWNGDCGPCASYMAARCLPGGETRYPLSVASYIAWVQPQIADGLAGANGAQNIPSMDAWLTSQGIAHTTTGYADFTLDALHAQLKSFGTGSQSPAVVEWQAAGLGLLTDQSSVQYHFSAFMGMDTDGIAEDGNIGGYLRGDGDARTDPAFPGSQPPILTSWQEITNAQPIAMIVLDAPTGGQGMWTYSYDAQGHVSGGTDSAGHHAGAGIAAALQATGRTGVDGLDGEEYYGAAESFLPLSNGEVASWTQAGGVRFDQAAQTLLAVFNLLQAAAAAAKAAQTPPVDPQVQLDASLGAALRAFAKELVANGLA